MKRRNDNTYPRGNFKYSKFNNKDIIKCYNLRDLLDIYHSYRNEFNVVNLATLIHKIAKLFKQRHQFDFGLWNKNKDDFIRSFYK